jgi:hypothetical protein
MIEPGARAPEAAVLDQPPWDRRLMDALARDAWVAANHPEQRPREPPLRDKVRSRWFWVSLLPVAAIGVVLLVVRPHGWLAGLLWAAYFLAIALAPILQRRVG